MVWGLPLQKAMKVNPHTHEHVGNGLLPWAHRAKLDGIVLRTFEPQDTRKGSEEIKNFINS